MQSAGPATKRCRVARPQRNSAPAEEQARNRDSFAAGPDTSRTQDEWDCSDSAAANLQRRGDQGVNANAARIAGKEGNVNPYFHAPEIVEESEQSYTWKRNRRSVGKWVPITPGEADPV